MSQEGSKQLFWSEDASKFYALNLKDTVDIRANVLLPPNDMSLCFWHKGYSLGSFGNGQYVFGWADPGWGGTRLTITQSVNFRYATGSSSTDFATSIPASIATDAKWRFFCIRKSASTVSILLNGSQMFSAQAPQSVAGHDSYPLSLGSLGNDADAGETQAHRGEKSICLLGIYERALSDIEVVKTMHNGMPLTDGSCVGFWPLTAETLLSPVIGEVSFTAHNKYGQPFEFNDLLDLNKIQMEG